MKITLAILIGAALAALLALWLIFQPSRPSAPPDCKKYQDTVPC